MAEKKFPGLSWFGFPQDIAVWINGHTTGGCRRVCRASAGERWRASKPLSSQFL